VNNFKKFRVLIYVSIKLGPFLGILHIYFTTIISFTPSILEVGVETKMGVKYSQPYKA
jgi:hypothetical protein